MYNVITILINVIIINTGQQHHLTLQKTMPSRLCVISWPVCDAGAINTDDQRSTELQSLKPGCRAHVRL